VVIMDIIQHLIKEANTMKTINEDIPLVVSKPDWKSIQMEKELNRYRRKMIVREDPELVYKNKTWAELTTSQKLNRVIAFCENIEEGNVIVSKYKRKQIPAYDIQYDNKNGKILNINVKK
jgi:hypothetical protein